MQSSADKWQCLLDEAQSLLNEAQCPAEYRELKVWHL
jgi:hypothetical protein